MRRYRLGLIQTSEQLYFSYKAIIEGIRLFSDPVNLTHICNIRKYTFSYCCCLLLQSFADYEEVPIPEEGPPLPPPRGESLDLDKRNNAATYEGRLSPQPPTKNLPTIIDETSNSSDDSSTTDVEEESDSDNESGDDVPSDVSREEINMADELIAMKRTAVSDVPPTAVHVQHTNGHEEHFDADATLPPPPTEKAQTNGFTSNIVNNNERYMFKLRPNV